MWQKIWEVIKKLLEKKTKPDPEKPDPLADAIDPKQITWLGVNVGDWKKTLPLTVSLSQQFITYEQDGTTIWPSRLNTTANPWVIAKLNGKWHAATHEWMTVNQKRKDKRSVHGDHIKRREFGDAWEPTVGEEYGFCVSGLCRSTTRNVSERTQIVLIKWH